MKSDYHKVFIVIPAYNEAQMISRVVESVQTYGYHHIIVVDDGSSDTTAADATQAGAYVVSHRLNRGKGAATKTGIQAALLIGATIVVTMDGDGQHDPKDIEKLVDPIMRQECDVALGSRLMKRKSLSMPFRKKIANHIANALTWTLHGIWVTDSQSGFRAYSKRALSLINTSADKYDFESEIIREIKEYDLAYKEIPIHVHYTPYSLGKSQRQNAVNAARTVYNMIWKKIS